MLNGVDKIVSVEFSSIKPFYFKQRMFKYEDMLCAGSPEKVKPIRIKRSKHYLKIA